ncbi:MAG: TRAP transporter substrate-binding protein DctP [Flavobacteriaceae bacterium]
MTYKANINRIAAAAIAVTAICGTGYAGIGKANAAEVEGPKVKWLFSLWGNRRAMSEGVEGLAEYVAKKTDGNFEISIQYGEALSSPKENIDGLYLKAFDAATVCTVYTPDKLPVLSLLDIGNLPIQSLEENRRVIEAYYKEKAVQDEFAKWNTVPIMGVVFPAYEIMGKGEKPTSLEKLKAMRMHASGGNGRLLKNMGISTQVVSAPDMYQAVERGLIDAALQPYTYTFSAYRLQEVSNWVTDGWALTGPVCHVMATKDSYDALPDQYKQLLKEGADYGYKHQIATYDEVEKKDVVTFKAAGLEWVPMSPDIRAAMDAAVKPAWDAQVKKLNDMGLDGQALLDSILKAASE